MLLEDKDKEDVNLGVPSFRTKPEDGETAFVEVSARGMEIEEDPTIQCQTVCQFVRPHAVNENLRSLQETENQTRCTAESWARVKVGEVNKFFFVWRIN